MSDGDVDGPVKIRLMNEYGVDFPLWDREGLMDGDELELSDSLRSDLRSFADLWEASIPSEVFDDRWDGNPIMSRIVAAKYSFSRLVSPAQRRAAKAEDVEMRRVGEELRRRLEAELGSQYQVIYQH